MNFEPALLPDVWIIDLDLRADERGFFARTFCESEFAAQGLNAHWPQCNLTLTRHRRTIRGLHFQSDPHGEIKLVRCAAGAIFDVVVDVRHGSAGFGQWQGFELTAFNRRALYIPAGFAHGFQCLADNSEVFYMMGAPYVAGIDRGLRWNDPAVGIEWPLSEPFLSPRDHALPFLHELA